MSATITIVIPAFNEESSLEKTVEQVQTALADRFERWEILLVNDGSTDGTGDIAESLAVTNPSIRVLHNQHNLGLGSSYLKGIRAATCEHVCWFPADNDVPVPSMEALFDRVGEADSVLHHTVNPQVRPLARQVISRCYTRLINTLFGLNLKYFNGVSIHRREFIQMISVHTGSYAVHAEILVKLLRSGCTYLEVGVPLRGRKSGSSSAFRLKNVIGVVEALAHLLWEVYVTERPRYGVIGTHSSSHSEQPL